MTVAYTILLVDVVEYVWHKMEIQKLTTCYV